MGVPVFRQRREIARFAGNDGGSGKMLPVGGKGLAGLAGVQERGRKRERGGA
jgi:hypothetical protein